MKLRLNFACWIVLLNVCGRHYRLSSFLWLTSIWRSSLVSGSPLAPWPPPLLFLSAVEDSSATCCSGCSRTGFHHLDSTQICLAFLHVGWSLHQSLPRCQCMEERSHRVHPVPAARWRSSGTAWRTAVWFGSSRSGRRLWTTRCPWRRTCSNPCRGSSSTTCCCR